MDDKSIVELATKIIEGVKEDFQKTHYDELGGELKVMWGTERIFNASAYSEGKPENPPQHTIRLTYELALQIYRDGEGFYEFLSGDIRRFEKLFLIYEPPCAPPVPSRFNKDEFLVNYFAAALTWVFAHEIGHLTQEHGYIRTKFGGAAVVNAEIHEYAAKNTPVILNPRESAVSHVTELAADYEATNWCYFELVRHFAKQDGQGQELFLEGVFIFLCAITCTFYRFNGLAAVEPTTRPKGSHPHSIFRIEKNISHLIELIDHAKGAIDVTLSRKELVHFYHRGATAASLFWFSQHAKPIDIPQEFIIGGAINHPNMKVYIPIIISTWDEIEPEIKSVKRFALHFSKKAAKSLPDWGTMEFTEDMRARFP